MSAHRFLVRRWSALFLLASILALLGSSPAGGKPQETEPPKGTCSPTDYKILTPYAVAIQCDVKPTLIPDAEGQVILVTKNGQANQMIAAVKVMPAAAEDFLIVYWPPSDQTSLKKGNNYTFNLPYRVDASVAGKLPVIVPPLIIAIDTTDTLTLSSPQGSQPLEFVVTSHVAFAGASSTPAYTPPLPQITAWPACKIHAQNPVGTSYDLNAQCSQLLSPIAAPPTLTQLSTLDFRGVGRQWIRLKSLPGAPIIPANMPYLDVLGGAPTFDPKARFVRQNAPATKDASQIYVNVNYAAGVGTTPAWVLDGKYAPPIKMYDQFTLAPLLLADIGNNTATGQTYTNTIDLGGTGTRVFRPGAMLQLLSISAGATYETDKQFDRDNLLAIFDSQYFFKRLYNTQQQQAFRLYAQELQKNKAAQLSDIKPPLWGYQLDFHAGVETGGALADTTVHASKGSATEKLPQYPIFRLVPQVHFLVQLWKFGFDESFVGRYLATTENTIVQTPANTLFLHSVQGWKGISTLTSTFALDPQGNFNVTVAFKDGFAPPTYKRVNAVQAGFLIKY